jgi:adenylylsulfate kinase
LHNSSGDIPEPPAAANGAFCVWLMGLSASGKTTLAQLLARALQQRGFTVEVLDGDIVRTTLSKGLGFTHGDRVTNLRRIAALAENLVRRQVVTIVAAICPYHAIREEVRSSIGEYVEVFLNCPLEVCISRDPKGLYRKALAGEIQHFTGINDIFETPVRPDIKIRPAWLGFSMASRPCGVSLRNPERQWSRKVTSRCRLSPPWNAPGSLSTPPEGAHTGAPLGFICLFLTATGHKKMFLMGTLPLLPGRPV